MEFAFFTNCYNGSMSKKGVKTPWFTHFHSTIKFMCQDYYNTVNKNYQYFLDNTAYKTSKHARK